MTQISMFVQIWIKKIWIGGLDAREKNHKKTVLFIKTCKGYDKLVVYHNGQDLKAYFDAHFNKINKHVL